MKPKKNLGGAPIGNENRRMDPDDRRESFLYIRALRRDKAAWVRAANEKKSNLTDWATDALNREAGNVEEK